MPDPYKAHPSARPPNFAGAASDEVTALFQYGEQLFAAADYANAKETFSKVLTLNKRFAPAIRQIGLCQIRLNEVKKAIKSLQRYLKTSDSDPIAHASLAQAYFLEGNLSKAKSHAIKAVKIAPSADFYFLSAEIFEGLKEPSRALEYYKRGLTLDPTRLSAKLAVGLMHKHLQDYRSAIEQFEEILSANKEHAFALSNLGTIYHELGLFEKAIDCFRQALSITPSADIEYNLGLSYQQIGDLDNAIAAFDRTLGIQSNHSLALIQSAETHSALGEFDKSIVSLEQAHLLKTHNAHAYYLQSQLQRIENKSTDLEKQLLAFSKSAKTNESKIFTHFALGKIYDDLCDFDLAFKHFEIANRTKFNDVQLAANKQLDEFDLAIGEITDQRLLASQSAQDFEEIQPVFIVGMPRSGTTLLERTVASNGVVSAAGEVDYFSAAMYRLRNNLGEFRDHRPGRISDPATLTLLRAGYMQRLNSIGVKNGVVVDKTPDNFRFVELLALLFPRSRFLHCQRNPLDTCLSIYFQLFQGLPYSYSWETIAAYYSKYQNKVTQLAITCAPIWLDVNYEDLVINHEDIVEKISAFLGLALQADVSRRVPPPQFTIATMSKWQARQEIYQRSVKRSENYAPYLDSLKSELKANGIN